MNNQPIYINRREAFKKYFEKEIKQERRKTLFLYVIATPLTIAFTYLALWSGYVITLGII